MLTVLALAYMAPRIDLLVCEVGLGGRLDATNALDLGTAVITNIDYDHQKYLGNTIEQIANEKAAIIKPGNKVVTGCEGVALEIVESHAAAALTRAGSALRALINRERLVALFGMLSERDPVQILAALRSMHPDAAVFTEAESAGTHAVPATRLAEVYRSGGEAISPAAAALVRAKELAGTNGNVIVCGSLYLVGEILALHQNAPKRDVG